jgi:hypothetical protein
LGKPLSAGYSLIPTTTAIFFSVKNGSGLVAGGAGAFELVCAISTCDAKQNSRIAMIGRARPFAISPSPEKTT